MAAPLEGLVFEARLAAYQPGNPRPETYIGIGNFRIDINDIMHHHEQVQDRLGMVLDSLLSQARLKAFQDPNPPKPVTPATDTAHIAQLVGLLQTNRLRLGSVHIMEDADSRILTIRLEKNHARTGTE